MDIEQIRQRPWVLLPGTLCTIEIFTLFLDAFGVKPELRKAVALHHPNVEDYSADLQAVMQPGAVVCGFSLGAIVAAHHADRLNASAMLLFGLNPQPDNPFKKSGRLALERHVLEIGGRSAMAQRMPELHGPETDSAHETILDMAEQAAPSIKAQTQLALTRPGALAALGKSTFPVLNFTGSEDHAAPMDLAREAAAAAPHGRFDVLPGLGHYALLEDPHTCSNVVASAIAAIS